MPDVTPNLNRWLDLNVQLGIQKLADDWLTITLNDVPADVAPNVISRARCARRPRKREVSRYAKTHKRIRE
jgi:hypothetical protein